MKDHGNVDEEKESKEDNSFGRSEFDQILDSIFDQNLDYVFDTIPNSVFHQILDSIFCITWSGSL